MKLPFKPVINKINGKCYVIPSKCSPYKTIIKCDENTAQIINLLGSNVSEETMLKKSKEIFKSASEADLLASVRKVRSKIKSHEFKKDTLEVIEI